MNDTGKTLTPCLTFWYYRYFYMKVLLYCLVIFHEILQVFELNIFINSRVTFVYYLWGFKNDKFGSGSIMFSP